MIWTPFCCLHQWRFCLYAFPRFIIRLIFNAWRILLSIVSLFLSLFWIKGMCIRWKRVLNIVYNGSAIEPDYFNIRNVIYFFPRIPTFFAVSDIENLIVEHTENGTWHIHLMTYISSIEINVDILKVLFLYCCLCLNPVAWQWSISTPKDINNGLVDLVLPFFHIMSTIIRVNWYESSCMEAFFPWGPPNKTCPQYITKSFVLKESLGLIDAQRKERGNKFFPFIFQWALSKNGKRHKICLNK